MKRGSQQEKISALLDGELSPRHKRALEREAPARAEAERLHLEWLRIRSRLGRDMPEPPLKASEAWREVQARIREQDAAGMETGSGVPFAFRPLHGLLAAAALLLLAGGLAVLGPWGGGGQKFLAAAGSADIEWVETELPDAMAVVYTDMETGWSVVWIDVDEAQEDNGDA